MSKRRPRLRKRARTGAQRPDRLRETWQTISAPRQPSGPRNRRTPERKVCRNNPFEVGVAWPRESILSGTGALYSFAILAATNRRTMKRKSILRIFLASAITAIWCAPMPALDVSRKISQYAHATWRIRDGAFSGVPTAIAQTTDGYLWFGTPDGLFRFDGARFVAWTAAGGRALPRSDIHSLLGTPDGSLWIGTGRGLARWKSNDLTVSPGTGDWVNAIVEDHAGQVWIAR